MELMGSVWGAMAAEVVLVLAEEPRLLATLSHHVLHHEISVEAIWWPSQVSAAQRLETA